nr:hypothetical protein [Tanacetum cinerariifolium]
MAAGLRDRPPMLATERYAQWRSRFLRYIDTRPNGDALRKCILEGPYTPTTVVFLAVPKTDDSPAVPEHTTVETPMNMSPESKTHYQSEKEAIHLILTGIGDEIYSTIDACKQLRKCEKLSKDYNKVNPSTFKMPFKNTTGLKADEAGWGSNKSDHIENCSGLEGYSWGQKVVSGIEAEKGRAQVLGIKRWSVEMRLR